MQILFTLLMFFSLTLVRAEWRPNEVGNGGDVLICKNSLGKIISIELLDFHEARVLRPELIHELGAASLSVQQKLDLALTRLSRLDEGRSKLYKETVAEILDGSTTIWTEGMILPLIPDWGYLPPMPPNCNVVQIAVQREPIFPHDRRYIIRQDLWDQLDNDNRVGLLLHEAIYKEAIGLGHTNSIKARYFTELVSSAYIGSLASDLYLSITETIFGTGSENGLFKAPQLSYTLPPSFEFDLRTLLKSKFPNPGGWKVTPLTECLKLDSQNHRLISSCTERDSIKLTVEVLQKEKWDKTLLEIYFSRVDLAAGQAHTCAILNSELQCWGSNQYGQSNPPKLKDPHSVSSGALHSCAIEGEQVICWGNNRYGQTSVPNLDRPTVIASGAFHNCAIHDGGVSCWGWNGMKQATPPEILDATDLVLGGHRSCAFGKAGMQCWGHFSQMEPTTGNSQTFALGYEHYCFDKENRVKCVGSNQFGQLKVPLLRNPRSIVSSVNHSCGLFENELACWGLNGAGQTNSPQLNNPYLVSVGYQHTCAVDQLGIQCWGSNQFGQLEVPRWNKNSNRPSYLYGQNFIPERNN